MGSGGSDVLENTITLADAGGNRSDRSQLLEEQNTYHLVGDELFAELNEQEFSDLYPSDGQPGLSPVILAFVTVFQFIEELPDRQAAEALRMRLEMMPFTLISSQTL